MFKKLFEFPKRFFEKRRWQRKLENAVAVFNKFGVNFYDAAFVQKMCPNCETDTESFVVVAGKKMADIDYYSSIIMSGWVCNCGHKIPNYLDRFSLRKLTN